MCGPFGMARAAALHLSHPMLSQERSMTIAKLASFLHLHQPARSANAGAISLTLALLIIGCAAPPAGNARAPADQAPPATSGGTKRIVAAFQGEVIGLNGRLRRTGP